MYKIKMDEMEAKNYLGYLLNYERHNVEKIHKVVKAMTNSGLKTKLFSFGRKIISIGKKIIRVYAEAFQRCGKIDRKM